MGLFGFGSKGDSKAAFWAFFAKTPPSVTSPPAEAPLHAIGDALHKVDSRLAFQIGRNAQGLALEISADGNRDLIDTVRDVCAAAPVIPGWTIVAFRQPVGAAAVSFSGRTLKRD